MSRDELDRYADDLYKDRLITGSVYCGKCGYNLKTLPYVYTCPECGNSYNARPLSMKGIFTPQEASFPLVEIAAGSLCAVIAIVLLATGLQPPQAGMLVPGGLMIVLTVLLAAQGNRRLSRYLRKRTIARRIAMEKE